MSDKKTNAREHPGPRVVSTVDVVIAYKAVFADPEAQVVLADLVRHFGYTAQSLFQPDDRHPDIAASKRDGHREVLIHINQRIAADPAEVAAAEDAHTGEF